MSTLEAEFIAVPENFQLECVCNIHSRVCLSTAGLASHMRSHDVKLSSTHFYTGTSAATYWQLVFSVTKYVDQ